MSDPIQTGRFILFNQLFADLEHSSAAYRDYLGSGKTYGQAKILKFYNDRILAVLRGDPGLFGKELSKEVDALITHYEVWTEKWLAWQQQMRPADEEEFVFQNEISFPRNAARRLEAEWLRLKGLVG